MVGIQKRRKRNHSVTPRDMLAVLDSVAGNWKANHADRQKRWCVVRVGRRSGLESSRNSSGPSLIVPCPWSRMAHAQTHVRDVGPCLEGGLVRCVLLARKLAPVGP